MNDQIRSGFLDFDWGQLHVRGNPSGNGPGVLLLHQNPLSAVTYEEVLQPLAREHAVVALDTPGFGRSDEPSPDDWTVAEYARIVGEVADRLRLSPLVVVGQHTGACLAIELALQRPGRVTGLILIGVPCVPTERARERLAEKHPYEIAVDGSHLNFLWHRMQDVQYPGQLTPELATRHIADHLLAGPDRYLRAYRAVYTYPIQKRLHDLATSGVPVLLLSGEHDCIKSLHDDAQQFLPDAETVTIPRCSDFIMDEEPEVFSDIVSGFVRSTTPEQRGPMTHSASTNPGTTPDAGKVLYKAVVDVSGGRAGRAVSRSGALDLQLSRPAERGGDTGTDPEELFAAGFAACFDSAVAAAARRVGVKIGTTRTTAAVSLHVDENQLYSISGALEVVAENVAAPDLQRVLELAHHLCPYARAVSGNIDLTISGQAAGGTVTV